MLYEFEECKPDQVKYCVEFIGQKSKANASDYHEFLEGMGYKVFYKNINLNYSVGKVRLRPWAEKGGRIATNTTTFNRELLIVEKENDGNEYFYEIPLAEFFLVDHFHLSVGQCLCQSSHFLQFSATFGTQVKVFLKERFFLGGHFIHHVLSDLCGGICTLFLFHCITILE